MLVNKFNYTALDRFSDNGKRFYVCPQGRHLPSVTTILSATKPAEDARALEQWKRRVGYAKAAEISTAAANRGTRIHKYIERYVLEAAMPPVPTNPYAIVAHSMADAIIQQGLCNVDECWGTEVGLFYPELYAGTTDMIAVHNGQPAIIDFKQSNRVKTRSQIKDYFLQLAFYAQAHNQVYGTDIAKGVIMMCTIVDDKPKYLEFEVSGSEWNSYVAQMWDRVEDFYLASAGQR